MLSIYTMTVLLWFKVSSACVFSKLFKGRFAPVSYCRDWDFCTMSQRTARSPSGSRERPKSWPAQMQLVLSILPFFPRLPFSTEMEARTDLQHQANTSGADVLLLSVSSFPPIM